MIYTPNTNKTSSINESEIELESEERAKGYNPNRKSNGQFGSGSKMTNQSFYDSIKGGNYDKRLIEKYDSIVKNEPKITSDLSDICKDKEFTMQGLDYKLKTKKSTFEKLVRKDNVTLDKAIDDMDKMYDVVRYTYQSKPESMVKDYEFARTELEAKGYKFVEIKNQWMNNKVAYNGVNIKMTDEKGSKFELQFHTKESLALKNGQMHSLYEQQRVIKDTSSNEWLTLNNEMFNLSNTLQKPKNIERIK